MPTYDKVEIERVDYGIILNDCAEASISEPLALSGWVLDKANPDEAKACSDQLTKYAQLGFLSIPRQQMRILKQTNGHRMEGLADPNSWRYSVVRPTNSPTLNGAKLSEALRLADANLICELWCVQKLPQSDGPDTTIGGFPAQCFQYLHRAQIEESLSPIDLLQLSSVVALRSDLDEDNYKSIATAIEMFRDLDVNPPTPAKMLGYFGVIESLLSHAPKQNDSADSITRQLKRNLILLDNRMDADCKIGLGEFGQTKPDTVITKLYAYRSAIAHGGDQRSKIAALKQLHQGWGNLPEPMWAERFLRRMVKRVLVHAMKEPKLVVDLKG